MDLYGKLRYGSKDLFVPAEVSASVSCGMVAAKGMKDSKE